MVLEPVSYTHLDVYKRQCETCSKTVLLVAMCVLIIQLPENGFSFLQIYFHIVQETQLTRFVE